MEDENANNNPHVSKKELLSYFKEASKEYLMNENDFEVYLKLSDIVTVYRGVTDYNKRNIKALSWTLDLEQAKWFAERYSEEFNQERIYI